MPIPSEIWADFSSWFFIFRCFFEKKIKWPEVWNSWTLAIFEILVAKAILLISDLVCMYHSVKLTDAGEMSKFNPHGWAASTKMNDVGL